MVLRDDSGTIDVLNRLLRIVQRSLPVYLQSAPPWTSGPGQPGRDLLARMAADYQRLSGRIAEAVWRQGGSVDAGQFPGEFAAMHDLGLEFLLRRVYQKLGHDLETVKDCVYELAGTPSLQPLAQDVLRTAQEHLAALRHVFGDER